MIYTHALKVGGRRAQPNRHFAGGERLQLLFTANAGRPPFGHEQSFSVLNAEVR
jgi:hypothetical protein